MTEIPQRIQHNKKLADEYMTRWGITSSCPPVHEQLESVIIDRKATFGGYNGSIIRHQGRLLMAYRYYPTPSNPATQLAVAELDEQFNVKRNEKIQVNAPAAAWEDPRTFVFKDQLYISYVEVKTNPESIVVKYGLLVEGTPWRVVDIQWPKIGTNDGTAFNKNFLFWQHEEKLMCLYESVPEQIVFEINGSEPIAEHRSPGIQWPYGTVKGGAGPVPYKGKLLRFFHSTTDNEADDWLRRYWLGACLMEPTPPFKVIAISKEPIARGSDICSIEDCFRNLTFNYKPRVIFPAGVITEKDYFLVSVGVNDASSILLKIQPQQLNL